MRALFLRHGPAYREGVDPSLTDEGRIFAAWAARGIRSKVPDAVRILSSTLVRAIETAAIINEVYGDSLRVESDTRLGLESKVGAVFELLEQHSDAPGTIICVSHEPLLEQLTEAITGKGVSFDRLGGVLVTLDGERIGAQWQTSGAEFERLGRALPA